MCPRPHSHLPVGPEIGTGQQKRRDERGMESGEVREEGVGGVRIHGGRNVWQTWCLGLMEDPFRCLPHHVKSAAKGGEWDKKEGE